MSQFSNKKKSEQLGLPFGTASHRLKKEILFDLVKKCGLQTCFKCKEEIKNSADLTIEHKVPWLNVDPDLFWDLNNIAFSHSKCNIPHRQNGGGYSKRVNLDGFWLCLECKEYLPEDYFSATQSSGKPRSWCKACRAKRKRLNKVI